MADSSTTVLQRIREVFVGEQWPPPDLRAVWEEVERYQAFRESDDGYLRLQESLRWFDRYMVTPVPRMLSRASANLLFSEQPEIGAVSESDQTNLDFIVEENELASELHRAAVIDSSEGEVWGRITVRPDLLDAPIIEFMSRRRVIPIFVGRFLSGAIFVTEWEIGTNECIRLFESYEPGLIASRLYRGTRTSLGQEIPLDSFAETAGTPEIVLTGIEKPLCAFIPNSIDSDPSRGFSDYRGLEERFLSINRATGIGDSNTTLAGRKRALLDANYAGPGQHPLQQGDIYIRDADSSGLGEHKPLEILEYSYEAGQIVQWLEHLIDTTLIFGGVAPEQVGRGGVGGAVSGTALKLKMAHSLLESSGKGRYLDRGITRLLHFAQIVDSRPTTEIGFGRSWSTPDDPPSIERKQALPRDDMEAAQEVNTLVAANAISMEERVRFLHPDWSEDQIEEEIQRIEDDSAVSAESYLPPGMDPNEQLPAEDLTGGPDA